MFNPSEMQLSISSVFSAYASFTGTMMLVRSMANDIIPSQLRSYLESAFYRFFTPLSPQHTTIVIDESPGITRNEVYESAEIYLRSKITPVTDRFKVSKAPKQKHINVGIEKDTEVIDKFQGFELKWTFVSVEPQNSYSERKKYFELTFDKNFKQLVLDKYLPMVLSKSKKFKDDDKVVKLYTRDIVSDDDDYGSNYGNWGSINLEHPSTFDTLAMDPDMKKSIIDDLERFVRRRDYYKKVGKAWKRGYLLYGPPGTGKSSLVAAMANYLRFDIYDLELTSLYSNADLRRMLLTTTNRSIILIEDIDCSAQMKDREQKYEHDTSNSKLTLSGMLNFIDGLWSSCGDERIIVFTTNHKDKLDPALLRPGRMDLHIHMSYCTFGGFKLLASNYLGISDHRLFGEIEELIGKVKATPAEIAEELMKSEDVDIALEGVPNFLKQKEMQLAASSVKDNDEKIVDGGSSTEGNNEVEVQQVNKEVKKANRVEKMALKYFRKMTWEERKTKTVGR